MKSLVGNREQRDIEKLVSRILHDLGDPEPPLRLELVRELLKLDLRYYSSTDVTPLAEFAHRIRIAGKGFIAKPERLLAAVKKARLSGLWLPDEREILVDQEVPEPKHRWIMAHEISHSFVPWHAEFLLGDTEVTLEPTCHEVIEAEANFGAGRLLFLGDRFARDAADLPPTFASIQRLKQHYGNTLTSTFWRFIEDRDPDQPAFGLIGQHPKHSKIGRGPNGEEVRYFITSAAFQREFSKTTALQLFALIGQRCSWSTRGPVIEGQIAVADDSSNSRIFVVDGFSNSYQVLTLGTLR